MDFRTCPACNASVLEEDVDECPFCGASMSGKPKAKPAAPAKPASSAPKAVSSSAKPGKPSSGAPSRKTSSSTRPAAAAQKDAGGEEDPFEVDTTAVRRAVKLSPRPTKQRTMEVVCPMCETTGYMAPEDSGKDVQCCNPECMVPVFKTKRVVVEEEPEETSQRGWLPFVAAAVVLIGAGVGVWYFVLREPEKVEVANDLPEVIDTDKNRFEDLTPTENRVVNQEQAPPATNEEIRQRILKQIVDLARQRERNRSAEYGTQLAAEIFAESGDLNRANQQIKRLSSTAASVPYFQIQPLVEIGWQQLQSGQSPAAKKTAADALMKTRGLPSSVRKTQDVASALAALLMATGQPDQAAELVQREQDRGPRGTLSALWRTAVDARTFNIEQEGGRPWHHLMQEPMRIAVVESLVTKGQADLAKHFAATGEDVASQDACRAAWAGRLAQFQPADVENLVTQALTDVAAAGQTQAWAAVAAMAQANSNADLAQRALAKAEQAMTQIPKMDAVPLPNMKAIHDSEGKTRAGLPSPAPARSATQAALFLGMVQLRAGNQDAGWQHFQQALDLARSMTPGPAQTQELVDACENRPSAVKSQLAAALNLAGQDDSVRLAFNRYRRQCNIIDEMADQRFAVQVDILRIAANAGLLNEVWTVAQARSNESDMSLREPYIESPVASLLKGLAREAGNSNLASELDSASKDRVVMVEPIDQIRIRVESLLKKNDLNAASDLLEQQYRSDVARKHPAEIDEITLRATSQVQTSHPPEALIAFVQNLFDPTIQEDAFLLFAGDAMQHGKAARVWELTANSRELDALEHVAIYRGFIAGLPRTASPSQKPAPATSAE